VVRSGAEWSLKKDDYGSTDLRVGQAGSASDALELGRQRGDLGGGSLLRILRLAQLLEGLVRGALVGRLHKAG